VRRQWAVRITESLGPQRVSVPNVIGQTEREAAVNIRRLSLDLGTVAYIPAPGPAGIVLTQSPTPAAEGIDGPRISLLVSEPEDGPRMNSLNPDQSAGADSATPAGVGQASAALQTAPATTAAPAPPAYVMPNLVGLTLSAASARMAAIGLHITSIEAQPTAIKPVAPVTSPAAPGSAGAIRPVTPMAPVTLANTVVAQTPVAGHRVAKGDAIRVVLSR
jgi:beta-lactam-binding protein with PASTA domain